MYEQLTSGPGVVGTEHLHGDVAEDSDAGPELGVVTGRVGGARYEDGGRLRLQHHDVGLRRAHLHHGAVLATGNTIQSLGN